MLLHRELPAINELISVINRFHLKENMKNTWKWKATPDDNFKTKKAYDILSNSAAPAQAGTAARSLLNRILSKIPPIKSSAMAWRLLQDRLPTRVNLAKRNILPQTGNVNCPFCNRLSETAAHLFVKCNVSTNMWLECYKWLGVATAGHNQISNHFLAYSGLLLGKKGNMFAINLWTCIV